MMLRQLVFFFSTEKHLAFFLSNSWNWFHSLPMLRIVLGRGWRRLRRQTWVLAESGRRRHSHEWTKTDYSLPQTTHPLTPTHPGPIALGLFPSMAYITSRIDVSMDRREAP